MLVLYKYRVRDPITKRWYRSCHVTDEEAARRFGDLSHERLDYTRMELTGECNRTCGFERPYKPPGG